MHYERNLDLQGWKMMQSHARMAKQLASFQGTSTQTGLTEVLEVFLQVAFREALLLWAAGLGHQLDPVCALTDVRVTHPGLHNDGNLRLRTAACGSGTGAWNQQAHKSSVLLSRAFLLASSSRAQRWLTSLPS